MMFSLLFLFLVCPVLGNPPATVLTGFGCLSNELPSYQIPGKESLSNSGVLLKESEAINALKNSTICACSILLAQKKAA